MPLDLSRIVKAVRERIAAALGWDGTRWLAADEQTRLSWARPAKSYAEVPEVYRSLFNALPAEEKDPFPYTVITPTFKGFLHPENEKLICRIDGRISVLEQTDRRVLSIDYALKDICDMETGTILLSSWLTIHGMDALGNPSSSTLKYNSVTDFLFAPFVDGFRSTLTGAGEDAGSDVEAPSFRSLADLNFKFMNYARRSIQPGEKVVQTVLQSELRKGIVRLFGLAVSRQITPAHLTILTDSELILIRDDESKYWLKEKPYGGIWHYIPLKKISSVSLSGKEDDLLILSVRLINDELLNTLFHISQKAEAEKLRNQIASGIGR